MNEREAFFFFLRDDDELLENINRLDSIRKTYFLNERWAGGWSRVVGRRSLSLSFSLQMEKPSFITQNYTQTNCKRTFSDYIWERGRKKIKLFILDFYLIIIITLNIIQSNGFRSEKIWALIFESNLFFDENSISERLAQIMRFHHFCLQI